MKNLTIKRKLAIGFGVVIGLSLVLGAIALVGADRQDRVMTDYDAAVRAGQFASRLEQAFARVRLAQTEYELRQDTAELETNRQERETMSTALDALASAKIKSDVDLSGKIDFIREALLDYEDALQAFSEQVAAETKDEDLLLDSREEMYGAARAIEPLAEEIIGIARAHQEAAQLAATSLRTRVTQALATTLIVVVSLSLFFAYYMTRQIVRPVSMVARAARNIASGDLREDASLVQWSQGNDELGELCGAFITMRHDLREVVGGLQEGITNLSTSAAEIAQTAKQAAVSASNQVSTVTEVTTTTEEILQTGKAAAASADDVVHTSESVAERGKFGLDATQDAANVVVAIGERSAEITTKILHLSAQNDQISEIVNTVNGLAEQSNLLAVNASIEAAKAGDRGRGFAVVAAEVRNLSEQSKRSTEQIRGILSDIQHATQSAVMVTEEGNKRAQEGCEAIEHARAVVSELASTLEENSDKARQIAGAASQQAIGVEEISRAMACVSEASTDATSGAEVLEKSASSLAALASQLDTLATRYSL